ncbi:HDOD domain-containing protein [Cognatilysobacter terrigena]|uniref:HDOD domain-containing protein n=1 Tax=Cognatilysobacter terrigena TaxID=2488749 RepID=UPI001FEC508B|nr:HDOD domain-containing protein [Lysobacter terrigena]
MYIVIVGEEGGRAGELQLALQDFGLDWKVDWLSGSGDAVALPADRRIDVVVSDMQVGRMQGAALLEQVRTLHPEAARILLLDRGHSSDAMQALDIAHRFLRKPLDASELIEAVESVQELRDLLTNPTLVQTIGLVSSLPPPPKLYLELERLMQDPDVSAAEIATLISQDPAVVAKVLRLCNSAYFSAGRAITDMRTAVTRLGTKILQRLVLTTEALGAGTMSPAEREAMQERAFRTSRLASQLLTGPSAELAATAALLAEVGKLLPGVNRGGPDDSGPHYAEAGAYLLGLWGLPMPIVEAVAYHHRPGAVRMSGFWVPGAVHVACALVSDLPLDEEYLRATYQLERLPEWREKAEKLAAVPA